MELKTFGDIKTELLKEMDLEDEEFISDQEFKNFYNEAVDQVEAEIHKASCEDDYFLNQVSLSLVSGTSDYELPDDIYANKIRGITYSNGSKIYTVRRVRGKRVFEDIAFTQQYASNTEDYRYLIMNAASLSQNNVRMRFFPTPYESGAFLSVWYIRNMNKYTDDTDLCDLPEFYHYLNFYVKVKIMEKEINPLLDTAKANLQELKQRMVDTLQTMVEDADSEIVMDSDFYKEHY